MPIINVGNKEVLAYLKSQPYFREFKECVLREKYSCYIKENGTTRDAKVAKLIVLLRAFGNETIVAAFNWRTSFHRGPSYWLARSNYMMEEHFSKSFFKKKHIKSTELACRFYYDNS